MAQMVDALADYVMLHVGSSKYRARRFVATHAADGNARGSGAAVETKVEDHAAIAVAAAATDDGGHRADADPLPVPVPAPVPPPVEQPFVGKLFFEADSTRLRVVPASELRHLAPWSPRAVGADSSASGSSSSGPGGGWALDACDLKAVGRWGEALVYQYLVSQHLHLHRHCTSGASAAASTGSGAGAGAGTAVEWVNEREESRAAYDIVTRGRGGTTFVEVKTTRFDDLNVFEMSLWEWQFATALPRVRYHLYRVFNAGDLDKVRIVVVEDVLQMVSERRVKLCLAV
jgi:hypothetical protein